MHVARIFVVEDEFHIQVLYADLLEVGGHEVVDTAFTGEGAVLMYDLMDPKPDLTIMDHRMPIKNGLDATREILKMDPDAVILFISADPTIKEEALEVGAVGFMSKPFALVDLFETIERVTGAASAPHGEKE